MNFSEMLDELEKGKAAAREGWKNQETNEYEKYIVFMKGMQSIWQILVKPNPNAGNWLPLFEDFKACDWLILE